MIAAEEFTFPVISTNAAVNLALLPPLWRISDDADPDHGDAAVRQRRSFARPIISIDSSVEGEGSEEDAELQEKMDLLWEDFNEELRSSAETSDSGFSEGTGQFHNHDGNCGRGELEALGECGNVRQLNLIRAKTKPKKMESVVKVMKKIFSLQNTTRTNQQKVY